MASTDLALKLEGDISLSEFDFAVRRFREIVDEYTRQVDEPIEWVVSGLEQSSALVQITGHAQHFDKVETVARWYTSDVRRVILGEPVENQKVGHALRSLTAMLTDGVASMRFITEEEDIQITKEAPAIPVTPSAETYDLLQGRVRMITESGGLKFTLYDSIYDVGVTCSLQAGQEELMRDLWRHEVRVEGLVRRDIDTGRPRQVRDILRVERIPEAKPNPFSPVDARGIFRWEPGDALPEDLVRKSRDAG